MHGLPIWPLKYSGINSYFVTPYFLQITSLFQTLAVYLPVHSVYFIFLLTYLLRPYFLIFLLFLSARRLVQRL